MQQIARRKKIIMTIAVISALFLLTLTYITPDREGTLRTDLQVGDYYELSNYTYTMRYTIMEMDGDHLMVEQKTDNGIDRTMEMTKDEFLSNIYFSSEMKEKCTDIGVKEEFTLWGNKTCTLYWFNLNMYHVDEYGIIYGSEIGGVFMRLSSTSLIYGIEGEDASNGGDL